MKVLLVDDSKAARFAMKNLLEKQELEVDTAESGEDALEKLANSVPDIIFMDQSMPGMGGLAATEQIKSNPDTSHIPVVICTGNEGSKLEHMAAEAGAIGVLTKPPKAKNLQNILALIESSKVPTVEIEVPEGAGAGTQQLLQSISGLQQSMAQMEKDMLEKITHVAQSTDAKISPLQDNLSKLQISMEEQIQDQIKGGDSDQRIELEELRQQIEGTLEDMADREAGLKKEIASTTLHDTMILLNQRLAGVKDAADKLQSSTQNQLWEIESKISAMQNGILIKAGALAIGAAGLAFVAALLLL